MDVMDNHQRTAIL